jgi:hypothetical protein
MLSRSRWAAAAVVLILSVTSPLEGQRRPTVALTGGLGNVLGGLGAGVEYYLAGSRVSLSAGLGYWPEENFCDHGTLSGAGAVRAFIGGRHRGFVEGSYSLLQITCFVASGDIDRQYGPGLSAGYRYTGSDGFTFTAGVGVGDVPGEFGTEVMILLGLGYTFHRE